MPESKHFRALMTFADACEAIMRERGYELPLNIRLGYNALANQARLVASDVRDYDDSVRALHNR